MAGEAVVGALRAILSLDVVQFEEGTKKAQDAAKGFGAEMGKIFGEIIAIETIKKIGEGILGIVDNMDKMGKTAQKVGLSVEEFSSLSYAAKLADVSTEDLAGGMAKLDKAIASVAGGAKGDAAEAFKLLGITLKDLQTQTPLEIFSKMADRFSILEDGANKTRLAMELFGRGGAEFIAFLNEGSDGLKKSADEAKAFGQVISKEAAQAAQDFMDQLKRLGSLLGGSFINSIQGVLELWNKMIDDILQGAKNLQGSQDTVNLLAFAFKYLTGVLQFVTFDVLEFIRVIGLFAATAKAVYSGEFSKIPDLFKEFASETADSAKALYENEKALFAAGKAAAEAADQYQNLTSSTGGLKARIDDAFGSLYKFDYLLQGIKIPTPAIDEGNKKLQEFIDSLQKSQVNAQVSILTFGQLAGAAAGMKIQMEAAAVATQNHTKILPEQQAQLDKLIASAQNYATIQQALNFELANRTAMQTYQDDLRVANDLLAQGAINQSAFQQAGIKATTTLMAAYGQVANQILGDFASAFKELAQQNKEYAGVAKALAIGQAIAATYLSAVNAYAAAAKIDPFFLAPTAAAAAVAAGLANVAKIAATQFASGGSFKVGGGRSFTDTQMVSMALSPGEMVDVHRTGSGASGGGGRAQEINLTGIGPRDLFTGSMLRDLFDALNQGQRDGYKLKVVTG